MKKSIFSAEKILQNKGFKVTTLRIVVLELLNDTATPLTVHTILKKTKRIADTATTYRALNAFVERAIVRKLEITSGKASFELIRHSDHRHYVVCNTCNTIEPIVLCIKNINDTALKKTKKFKSVFDHALSFSGTCKKCTRAL